MSAEVNAETRNFSRAAPLASDHVARDADDARILAEQIKGFDSFLGEANDSLWRKHPSALQLFEKRLLLTQSGH